MLNVNNADVVTDFNGLAKLKNDARNQSPEALKQVAKQFESLFLNMVLKSMRQAKLGDGLMDSDQGKFYQDMYDQQLSLHLSGEPGIGLADLMVKQLAPDPTQTTTVTGREVTDYLSNSVDSNVTHRPVGDAYGDGITLESIKTGEARTFALGPDNETDLQSVTEAITFTKTGDHRQDFVQQLLPLAREAADELGVDPKVLIAQAALETGWGNSVIKNRDGSSSHNLFNIKAGRSWDGKQTQIASLEFQGGVAKKVRSGFRAYASYADSFNDYVKFIKEKSRYADALEQVSNPKRYMRELQQAGYATDPHYANKVMKIYNSAAFAETASAPEQLVAMR